MCLRPWHRVSSDLSLAQKLLELVLGQQAMVLDKGRHLWRTLRLIVDGAVNLHVAVKDGQEVLLALPGRDVTHPDYLYAHQTCKHTRSPNNYSNNDNSNKMAWGRRTGDYYRENTSLLLRIFTVLKFILALQYMGWKLKRYLICLLELFISFLSPSLINSTPDTSKLKVHKNDSSDKLLSHPFRDPT